MRTLDCTDLKCPLPLLRLKVAINEDDEDPIIRLITTDAISLRDIPAFCNRAGHRLVSVTEGPPHAFDIEVAKR
ncbi:MAG: sulfurtransferase TusA family protein [Litorivicinaceae bacterium]|jgi:tRNA 2-thiouridine synthesizing protein A|nr:sulfurtransferase TusA family protein [Litorivicinaceae bacterium]